MFIHINKIASLFTLSSVFPKDSMSSGTHSNHNISNQKCLVKTWKPGSRSVNLIFIFCKLGSFLWKYFMSPFSGELDTTEHVPTRGEAPGRPSLREHCQQD